MLTSESVFHAFSLRHRSHTCSPKSVFSMGWHSASAAVEATAYVAWPPAWFRASSLPLCSDTSQHPVGAATANVPGAHVLQQLLQASRGLVPLQTTACLQSLRTQWLASAASLLLSFSWILNTNPHFSTVSIWCFFIPMMGHSSCNWFGY